MKKAILLAVLLALFSAFFTACGGNGSGEQVTSQRLSTTQSTAANSALSPYRINITGHSFADDTNGMPAIIVDFVFSNNSSETISMQLAVEYKGFQSGMELETTYLLDASFKGTNASKDLRPGASIEAQIAFVLDGSNEPIEVEFTDWDLPQGENLLASAVFELAIPVTKDEALDILTLALDGQTGEGEEITSIAFADDMLVISVDFTNANTSIVTAVDLAESRTASITDAILEHPEIDPLWSSIKVDFGEVGYFICTKDMIVDSEYGRYFDLSPDQIIR